MGRDTQNNFTTPLWKRESGENLVLGYRRIYRSYGHRDYYGGAGIITTSEVTKMSREESAFYRYVAKPIIALAIVITYAFISAI